MFFLDGKYLHHAHRSLQRDHNERIDLRVCVLFGALNQTFNLFDCQVSDAPSVFFKTFDGCRPFIKPSRLIEGEGLHDRRVTTAVAIGAAGGAIGEYGMTPHVLDIVHPRRVVFSRGVGNCGIEDGGVLLVE